MGSSNIEKRFATHKYELLNNIYHSYKLQNDYDTCHDIDNFEIVEHAYNLDSITIVWII